MSQIRIHSILVGGVPASFARCERADRSQVIDVEAARRDHAYYVDAIAAGVELVRVEPDDRFADCMFVEDVVVVLDSTVAVLARPGAESRRGEVARVAGCLPTDLRVEVIESPATLDGGDALRIGRHLFVGNSVRTNAAGIDALERAANAQQIDVVRVRVPSGLHLKSACTIADEHTLVYDPAVGLDLRVFAPVEVERIAAREAAGANVLALGGGRVVVSAAAPETAKLLRERGNTVVEVGAAEVHKADGGLTCCSVRIPSPGAWCT